MGYKQIDLTSKIIGSCPPLLFSLPRPGGADDKFEVVVARLPAGDLPDSAAVGDERRGIARAAAGLLHRKRDARDLPRAVDHLTHRIAVAVATVHRLRPARFGQTPEGQQVCGGEVVHMDVVTHAGAVRRRIVGPVDGELRVFALRGLQRPRDQVGRFAVALPDPAFLVRPGDLSRVNAAFFTMNGYVSVLFFLFWAADIFLLRSGT